MLNRNLEHGIEEHGIDVATGFNVYILLTEIFYICIKTGLLTTHP